jgi:hypothetical protein
VPETADTLYAGAARRAINPPLGTRQTGFRLFGSPVQAIESDLTATALVLAGRDAKVVIIGIDLSVLGIDLSWYGWRPAQSMRERIAGALGIPVAHVLLNTSHAHSGVALPDIGPDSAEQMALKVRYRDELADRLVEVALDADGGLQEARIGTGWGRSAIGSYRRELRDGRDVLGEVPGHPLDDSVGVIRVDDLDGEPIAVVFRYSAHPVTMGPRSMVVSSDYPGPARDVVERNLGGLALFLQGCGGNLNPVGGIGYEVDCRDAKNRIGLQLGGEVLRIAAAIRTNRRAGTRRTLANIPRILFTPWEPVGGGGCTRLAAAESSVALDYVALPSAAEAEAVRARCRETVAERRDGEAQEWEVRVAEKYLQWSEILCAAVASGQPTCELYLQAIRVNDTIVLGMNAETFFETGLELRLRSPLPDTFVHGYTNGTIGYLPRSQDYPEGGWRLEAAYAVPDMIFQVHPHPVALRPDSEQRVVAAGLALIRRLCGP